MPASHPISGQNPSSAIKTPAFSGAGQIAETLCADLFPADHIIQNGPQYGQKHNGNDPQYFLFGVFVTSQDVEDHDNIEDKNEEVYQASHR